MGLFVVKELGLNLSNKTKEKKERFNMAQVKFTKLQLKVKDEVKILEVNGEEIEVLQYLPASQKIALVSGVVANSMLGRIVRSDLLEIYLNLAIVEHYTNISFTDKQKEKNADLYDMFESNELFDAIVSSIPLKEYEAIVDAVNDYADKLATMSNSLVTGYTSQVDAIKNALQDITAETLANTFSGNEES